MQSVLTILLFLIAHGVAFVCPRRVSISPAPVKTVLRSLPRVVTVHVICRQRAPEMPGNLAVKIAHKIGAGSAFVKPSSRVIFPATAPLALRTDSCQHPDKGVTQQRRHDLLSRLKVDRTSFEMPRCSIVTPNSPSIRAIVIRWCVITRNLVSVRL